MKSKRRQSLAEVLIRTSKVMYPDQEPHLISVDARDVDGDTPLHKVALWGDRRATLLLLDEGAEIDVKGDMGCTPLYYAVMNKHVAVAKVLLEHGANPDHRSELGFTSRELASHSGHEGLTKLLRVRKRRSMH